nr:helicase domino [Vanessa tameamea]
MSGRNEPAVPIGATSTLPLMGVERGNSCGGGGGGGGVGDETINGVAAPERADEPPRKRTKLLPTDDVSTLRKRVLEYKLLRLKNLRDRFTEQLSELYFLQAGGNMMDYAAWRKRPPAPQLVAFLEARRPPPAAPPPPEPPPVPVTLPPTVAVITSCSPQTPAVPVVIAPVTSTTPAADEMVEKAKQEAYVAARVAELARAGLWTERRLPRVLEPPRPKTHWDYLLEEMAWLAQDFAHERKWKKQAAKKCARAVQKYFQDKAAAAQKAEKAQELQLKKIAAFAAKEIRMFWTNVEKLVEWKRVRRVERARKEALDEQLSYIVDRTERYSRQLAANLGAPAAPALSHAPDTPPSDDEFQPRGDSDDDEETIAAAEREAADDAADHRDEIEALRRESHLDLGDLLPPGYLPAHSPPPSDYGPDDDSADDEDTIAEQEQNERPEDAAAEIAALKDEADLDINELVRRYAGAALPVTETSEHSSDTEVDSDDDDNSESASVGSSASEQLEALMETKEASTMEGLEEGDGADGAEGADGADGEQRVEAAASLAATLQPTGNTLSETVVGTPVPRLLRHSLREYQHVGLHWLATMHTRRLNGILADEMGLGKTIQTIALLAHLALEHHDWGPHLVVAPTSVVLNWEIEFKKWCPSFKILTYYGTIKERKLKRVGWTKANSFHVCITSYKLVVQDHQSFRRKKWKYLILDEAQNIKNFKSQRWQMLLNFQTERRLLLTGTPLQNSLLELWSLMHFLMPDVFASHTEFREWFAPVAGIADGSHRYSDALVRRLHEVLRPFLLRRLKADVERQMPRKYEHVLLCRLSKRQRFLYDDFMSRAKTKECLASGNLLSVINVLMQLRKVCNHPDLFEPRPVASPLQLTALRYRIPALTLITDIVDRVQFSARLGGDLASLEVEGAGAFAAHRARHLAPPRRLVEELPDTPRVVPPRPPPAALRLHLRLVPRTPPTLRVPPAAPLVASGPVHASTARATVNAAPPPATAQTARGASARLDMHRRSCLRRLATVNERRCWRLPLFGADLREAVCAGPPAVPPRNLNVLLDEMHDIIDRFGICWASCRASAVQVASGAGAVCGAAGARDWRRRVAAVESAALAPARAVLALLHAPASRHAVAFPHPRLLQYDCGKLQTLDGLLRRLRAGGHRVLIFTQMTRVLDVLEGFLSMHGHTYLRLDGATKVDQRQPLVDRFNGDPRIFAFILSTRSGGVGLNLTGADSVVFYDSDWNPTMDAQAQDRCHRIGQTRDVHVYRLVTAATVEENILRKAEQKRTLGHLAIEDGHFTTSYLRAANIKELFGAEAEAVSDGGDGDAAEGGELESALAAAEDEADAAAAQAARAEAQGDLAEFDETLPLDDEARDRSHAASPRGSHEDPDAGEFAVLMKQLTPVEKYAMRLVETSEAATEAERAALGEMRRQLREWEQARRALRDEPASMEPEAEPDPELTYSREDSRAKVRARRRRRARLATKSPPAPPPPPSPPPSPPAPPTDEQVPPAPEASSAPVTAAGAPRTRSRGTVHINLWTLDEAGAEGGGGRRRALRNGTLDSWLAGAPDRQNNK